MNKTWLVPCETSKADSRPAVTSCTEFEEPHVAVHYFFFFLFSVGKLFFPVLLLRVCTTPF